MPLIFQTTRLENIIEKVRRQHPNRRSASVNINSSLIDEVREILDQTTYDDIPRLVYTLNSDQLLACIEIVAIDKDTDTAQKAAYTSELRPREKMMPRAWFHLVRQYPNNLLEKVLKELLSLKGSESLVNYPKISDRAVHWLINPKLSAGILKHYVSFADTGNLDTFLTDNYLEEWEQLYLFTWQELLLKGSRKVLTKQSPERILDIFNETLESVTRMEMGQNYLNILEDFPNWNEQVLEYLNDKWGQPKFFDENGAVESRFWEGVNRTPKQNFNKWVMLQAIEDFFEGERADFWRFYLDQGKIIYVEKILGGDGFMLDFEGFGVIEFKNKGNAAYIYAKETFDYFRGKARFWNNDPAYFKDKTKTISSSHYPSWDGRVLHFQNWQVGAKHKIDSLIRER